MRRTATFLAGAYWLAVILACGGPPEPGASEPASDRAPSRQDLWERCSHHIQEAQCIDGLVGAVCMREIGNDYFGQPTMEDAKLVLTRNGCPESMVR